MRQNDARATKGKAVFDHESLKEQVIETARRWMRTYDPQSSMYHHAAQTLAYWEGRE